MKLFAAGLLTAILAQAGVVLTFDQAALGPSVDQAYGDNVSSNPQAGNSYGVIGGAFTPNVAVTYGTPGELINIWSADYGDLTGIAYNDQDGDTTLTIRFDAAGGFNVLLFSFDLGGWNRTDYTLQNVSILDGASNTLFSQNQVHVEGDNGHTTLDFGTGLQASSLIIVLDLTGLNSQSDNIGIDNIHFGQAAVTSPGPGPNPVPEPSSLLLCVAGLAAAAFARKR